MLPKLRIALNHTRLGPRGGVEGYVYTFLKRLLDAGHEVDYYCHKIFEAPEHPNFRAIPLKIWRSPSTLRLWTFASVSARTIQAAEREKPYDVVHGFGKTWYHTVYRDGGGCHADYRALYLDPIKRGVLGRVSSGVGPYDRVMEAIEARRFALDSDQLVIANSQWVADQILARHGLPKERVRVILSGVDCERYRPDRAEAGREALAQIEGLLPDVKRLIFVSNDHARKGLPELLEAFAETQGAQLLVVGNDPHEALHKKEAARHGLDDGRVLFVGPRGDLPDLLPACDLFVLPTRFDALPNAALEALASGLPVLTSKQTGAAELVRDGENGWVVDAVEAGAISKGLNAFFAVDDPQGLRSAARASAEVLSWDSHFGAVEEAYAASLK